MSRRDVPILLLRACIPCAFSVSETTFFGASIQRKNSKKIKHVLFYSKRIALISSKEQCILKRVEKETFHSLGRNSSS